MHCHGCACTSANIVYTHLAIAVGIGDSNLESLHKVEICLLSVTEGLVPSLLFQQAYISPTNSTMHFCPYMPLAQAKRMTHYGANVH